MATVLCHNYSLLSVLIGKLSVNKAASRSGGSLRLSAHALAPILAGFIVLEQVFEGLHLRHPIQHKFLEVARKRVHKAALVTVKLA